MTYKTVAGFGTTTIDEKKSKFIGNVFQVKTEEEAIKNITSIKKKHYDATHNVFAYQIGKNYNIRKMSDDGEPSGTAGHPILDGLIKEKITNVLVVVTRYFGGTLLGTGGLIRAYSKAAKEALYSAKIITLQLFSLYSITISYDILGKVQFALSHNNYKIANSMYLENVEIMVYVPAEYTEKFLNEMNEVTYGKCDVKKIKDEYREL